MDCHYYIITYVVGGSQSFDFLAKLSLQFAFGEFWRWTIREFTVGHGLQWQGQCQWQVVKKQTDNKVPFQA